MKITLLYIKQILTALFMILCFHNNIWSQGTDISRGKQQNLFIGVSLGPSQSQIINEGTLSVSKLLSGKMSSFSGSVEAGYFFSNNIGLSSGLGFTSYKTLLTLDAYQNKFTTKDSEVESYERRITGSGIKEEQKVGFLSVPLSINFRYPLNKKIGFSLQSGINLLVPLSKNYNSSGTFTFKGYYSAYNILLEDLPAFGFPSNLRYEADGKLELKPVGFSAIVAAGIDFFIQKKIQLIVAGCYDKSLSDISKYTSPDSFQLSSDKNQINSLMGGSSKATAQSIGLKISFRYYIK